MRAPRNPGLLNHKCYENDVVVTKIDGRIKKISKIAFSYFINKNRLRLLFLYQKSISIEKNAIFWSFLLLNFRTKQSIEKKNNAIDCIFNFSFYFYSQFITNYNYASYSQKLRANL